MTTPTYQVYAIKYAEVARKAYGNFIDGDPHDNADMPLNYYVWAVVGGGRTIVVDTGFDAAMAGKRGRTIVHPVEEGLEALGIRHADVPDVIITHMHYDHSGNAALFPNARFHMQDAEMEYVTGRSMCHHQISHAFEADDVARMVHRVFAGRVLFHDGTDEIAPGVTVHRLGGHTKGLQCVRVATDRGHVVLASDATHFYAHIETGRAFPVLYNLGELLEGYKTLRRLASSESHVIPGHDPLVIDRYPAASSRTEGWIARVDAEPTG
ncbi:MAG: N-acyl homoserine lactonase family protein [Gammaproteobacteria bacterium]|nr:N-acyl homoserine lactonase family protein [Gammaproteobacteria bacterium]